jgi:hypothetical protein
MLNMQHTPIMDVSPWPDGRGFTGAQDWWNYVMAKDEKQKLDNLMGLALLDEDVCERLVNQRDRSLYKAFGLSAETQAWLSRVKVSSLPELAEAIIARS